MGKKNGFRPFYERWESEDLKKKKVKGWIIAIAPAVMLFGVPVFLWLLKKMLLAS